MKNIPRPEEHSAELAAVEKRQTELIKRQAANRQELAAIHAKAATPPQEHKDRVAALVAGISYEPPADDRDAIARLVREERDIKDALDEIALKKNELTRQASAAIVKSFRPEYEAIATEFYSALCLAAAAHWKLGALRRDFMRAGVDPTGLTDFGRDFFGAPSDRNNDLAIDLRKAARNGLIKESQVPVGYR
ncbi:hypothetical protein J5N58_08160 [Rhizobium cremeum]|uniref:hypothetical protein n=1 Tax=Rhizobium cremeum TaxID=2813827 RepID=UPI001FD38D97|nr:hypothetical protein [Rhizobium cremeum]MCJ7995894.1 hypothetical protein [Rhizobium cremeum]MCJ7999649.1 hypothetical protein [Rhizobium cremeum]